ncbi:DNA-3-methyladenine glycosylase I [Telluribacter sp.]|jgi:DNA-3-methyladenine glycosylase I|uniref:DNA-3-methyladenine glycosylase I n=1 Tax=Telluribacter sp. TaxID=1978767 RepID=UPI002E12D51A|nr:DNA-3-methyladenine glycosylase I [Telluribacter sp.]
MSYCDYINLSPTPTSDYLLHRYYHDNQYGFPLEDDNELFGRLLLEINQAGLSWTLMLRKQEGFRSAYSNFSISQVAAYAEEDVARLLMNPGIIRNRLKVQAAIHNARVILDLQQQHGSFKAWLDLHHPATKADWLRIFKKRFRFVGGEIVNEFLMSTGYLPGAHSPGCPVYASVLAQKPRWLEVQAEGL